MFAAILLFVIAISYGSYKIHVAGSTLKLKLNNNINCQYRYATCWMLFYSKSHGPGLTHSFWACCHIGGQNYPIPWLICGWISQRDSNWNLLQNVLCPVFVSWRSRENMEGERAISFSLQQSPVTNIKWNTCMHGLLTFKLAIQIKPYHQVSRILREFSFTLSGPFRG